MKTGLLDFLIENRKKVGDVRYEGYFSVGFMVERFRRNGYDSSDIILELKVLLMQGMIISERLVSDDLTFDDAVRVHASGYIHARILTERLDYVAAAALVTPLISKAAADRIGKAWRIREPRTDPGRQHKAAAGFIFLRYLEDRLAEREHRVGKDPDATGSARAMLNRIRKGLEFRTDPIGGQSETLENEFDQLFGA